MNITPEELRILTQPQPHPAAEAPRVGATQIGFRIAVLDRGWVIAGHCEHEADVLHIAGAKCIRRWGTTKGLGEIAETGPTTKTVLDPVGTVDVPWAAVKLLIVCQREF
jgi:hypothetical protein